jgi:hypothetical protein
MPKYLKDRIRHNGHREAKPLAGRMLLSDGMRSGIDPPEELEHDVLLRGRIHWAYAPAGVGKSWLSLWLTKRCLERGEKVIYFDSELFRL